MGDNKIRSTSDKIVGSPSDRKRKVKSQESGENGSKSWIEKVRENIGPASAGNLLKTAFMSTLALTGGAEARLEPFGSVPGLVGGDNVAALPPAPFAAYDQRVRFTSDYVPTPQNYKAFQQLEKQWQNPPFYLDPPPDVQASSSGETSQSTLETHQREQNENKWRGRSNEKKIVTARALRDKLKENPEALQILEKMLNEKKERERSLLKSDSKIPAARTLLTDEKSVCHDPCSDIPASVNCIKECTTDEISGYKNAPTCLDVSTSGVSARIEPISSLQGSGQQVFLDYYYNLRVQNNCPHPISNINFQIDISAVCPSGTTGSTADSTYGSIANRSSVAPGDSAGVKAGQDTSIISRCETYGGGFRITSSSLPPELSVSISASGTDSTTNSQIYSQKKVFTVLGPSVSEGTTFCDQKCPTANPPATDTPSIGHKGPNRGAIAGGVIGGVSALALAWYCCSSRRRDRRPRAAEPSSRPNDVHPRAAEPPSRPDDDVHLSLPNSMPSERMGFR